ncbi:GDSL-like Lipase/Acylhydrolase [Musa troglodytarum]|uniref:GDSL-like Lipase/Acylhydrolase n=1 Tax=Musa troglodytarum TaxID=320322 RepID=A0A9E7JJH9_9LILI|nr:GDSL-like Lipase/Acylhydrolase [Musa troglodytarum]URD83054.1 GDSL-like Lipase/Acylhydrolase [Musa troglodytarum]
MEDECSVPPSLALPMLLLLLLLDGVRALSTTANKTTSKVPAVVVFGDSIVDPGNNNVLPTFARCNFPPYGKDFPGGKATGRFSNGRNPSDILASQLGVKEYVPAYLGTHLDAQELLTGISFASGGCGYDPLTSQLLIAVSLRHQLNLFKEYKEKLKRVAGEGRAADIIANSFYAVVTGTNDIATTYFLLPFRREEFDIPSYIAFLVRSASSFLQVTQKTQRSSEDPLTKD